MRSFFSKPRCKGAGSLLLKASRKTAPGMTLVELLVTMVVLAFGIAGVLALQGATMNNSAKSSALNMAIFLAESQSEMLRAMEYNKVAFVSDTPEKLTKSGIPCADSPDEGCFFTRTTIVKTAVPTKTSTTVHIKMEWLNQQLIYDTVVSNTGFF